MSKYEELGKGVVRRKERRKLGLFIDGTGLDRATRRINRKVDMTALVKGVTSGTPPIVARYYTLIPYEDDSRQRAFLDAVTRAGLSVIVKRLPPKGVARQVSVDVEMAADMVAFSLGHYRFSDLAEYKSADRPSRPSLYLGPDGGAVKTAHRPALQESKAAEESQSPEAVPASTGQASEKRMIVVVCPSRDLSYPISLIKDMNVDTTTADFGQFNSGDILKAAAKWLDLSDSETIWRD